MQYGRKGLAGTYGGKRVAGRYGGKGLAGNGWRKRVGGKELAGKCIGQQITKRWAQGTFRPTPDQKGLFGLLLTKKSFGPRTHLFGQGTAEKSISAKRRPKTPFSAHAWPTGC